MVDKDAADGWDHDIRTLQWYLRRGKLTRKEYDRYLRSLPDSADKSETIGVIQPRAGNVRRDGRER